MRLSRKNFLTQCSFYAAAFGLSLGIASPTLAADRINLYIDDREIAVTITQLEEYSRTGNRSSLPPEIEGIYPYLEPEEQDAFDKFPAQLKKAISIQPNEQLDPDEQDFLNFLVPSKQPQEQQQVLELMAEKGNGQTILDFLKALPVETLTQDNFVSVLTAYTPTKSKAPQPKTPQPKTPTPIDLRTWTQEGLLANGRWVVSPDGSSVLQTINGRPTFFVSPDNFINATINGTFKVQDSDNDFIGFVFGYQSPFTANGNPENDFDFFLFDWKKNLQTEPFAGRSGIGQEGFSLTKVNESIANPIPSFWWHEDSPQFDVLATDYGSSKGWRPYQEYDFTLLYQTDRIKIDIDGETIFDISGQFQAGHFGFYNYSQKNVTYSGFTQEETPAQSVPEPTSVLSLLTFGAFGTVFLFKRKR